MAVSVMVALITMNWFFRDGDDSTRSFEEYANRPLLPWWCSKFGLWLGISAGSGSFCYFFLRFGWGWLVHGLSSHGVV